MRPTVSRSRWQRRLAVGFVGLFGWSGVLAVPAQALAHPSLSIRTGVRTLSLSEMQRITGSQVVVSSTSTALDTGSGSTYPWEATSGDTNTGNGNKLTEIPLVGWTARGGMPLAFTLTHNSQSTRNAELGAKWTHSFNLFLVPTTVGGGGGGGEGGGGIVLDDGPGGGSGSPPGGGGGGGGSTTNLTAHWGDDLAYTFTQNVDGSYSAPTGIHDILVKNVDGSYTLTRPDQTKYHYTSGYLCDTITDRNGNQVTISYNTAGLVTSVTDPSGRVLSLTYNTSSRVATVTDPLSRVWTLAYDGSGNLSGVTYPTVGGSAPTQALGYNAAHDITTFTDRRGHSATYTYNSNDSIATETDFAGNVTSYSYASTGTTVTDPNSHTTVYTYSSGRLSQITDGAGQSESYLYDAANNKTQITDKAGYLWQYTYDSAGNVLTSQDPYTNTTTIVYNSHNFPLTVTDALGNQTVTTYDSHDNATVVQRKNTARVLLAANTFAYDSNGLLTSRVDGNSHTTTYGYDLDGNLTTVTDANSHTVTTAYNGLGLKTSVTDALGHSTTYTLDAWGRATSVATPAGTTATAYDANSNATSVTDPNGHVTTTVYDNNDRPTSVTKPNGDVVTYAYDATGKKGLLSSKTDGNSHTTVFTYTNRNQRAGTSYADGTSESWTYTNDGLLASHTDANSHVVTYGYDHRGLLTSVGYPVGTGVSYTYNVIGQKTGMTDATGTTSYTYDVAGRTTGITTPNGTVSYAYDAGNRRTGMTLTGAGTWAYSYDAGNRLTQIVNPNSETTAFSYDAADRQTGQTNANGSTVTTTFDNANRPTEILHKTSGGATLADYLYSYDGAGNVTARTDTDGTVTAFGYDNANQLNSEARSNAHGTGYTLGYTYDHNGNRLTKVVNGVTTTNTYGLHDQLLTSGSKSYAYDSNGNCTSVTLGTSVTSLTYDYENRVTGITYPGSATNAFAYNGSSLRTDKTDSTGTFHYVCDGTNPAAAVLKDSSAVYTPGLSERRGTTSKFYHGDALGSTRGITDATQAVTDSVLYDAFGMTVSRTGTTPTPFGFAGKDQYQTDTDSGLMLLGHRYYDADAGRFISQDPAQDGNNWYAYCNNNPLRWTDASGLKPGDKYKTIDEAGKQAIKDINPTSIKENVEYAGVIYKNPDGTYSYTKPNKGTIDSSDTGDAPKGTTKVGDYHTHGAYDPKYDSEHFSDDDKKGNDSDGIPGYLGTPSGGIKKYNPDPKKKQGGKVEDLGKGAK